MALILIVALSSRSGWAAETNAANHVTLGDPAGPIQAHFLLQASNAAPWSVGALVLRAYGETLLGQQNNEGLPPAGGALAPLLQSDLLVNGRGPDNGLIQRWRVLERNKGRDWEHLCVDLAAGYSNVLSRYQRHLLFVQPNLIVLYDDLAAREPATFEVLLHVAGPLTVEPRSGDLMLELPKAGFTGRLLTPARSEFTPWTQIVAHPAGNAPTRTAMLTHLHTGSTNRLAELRWLTAFIVHPSGGKRGAGFFLLQGDNAIGARIYRDGLPTLIAFRSDATVPEANLTGLRFKESLAVDVFKSRRPAP